ncbi:hypothetical protein C9374_013893 [Naegleria lovaniensis]|uniref:F-box domain-containing protein n=1 Tax=Naegleria lovaniensis TaxID=51637 RepID=A0AA88KPD7_NAELO|nr:uncharacterized protein C9374_013893 [Naegleria lovaniensis]KAG2389333.1 hypothetical protein C9374_013893 [Naegleria lovaniensis]
MQQPLPSSPPPASTRSSLPPNCKCSPPRPSVLLTVFKQGPNKGRRFYSCSERFCKFFQWADEDRGPKLNQSSPQQRTSPVIARSVSTLNYPNEGLLISQNLQQPIASSSSSASTTNLSHQSNTTTMNATNLQIPTCRKHSNIPCRLLQVVKEGPNKGKLFWACGMSFQNERCNHFGWFEGNVELYKHLVPKYSTPPSASSSSSLNSSNDEKSTMATVDDEEPAGCSNIVTPNTNNLQIPTCQQHANTPCRLLRVVKEGPNKGKLFWCCGVSAQHERCKYFAWFEGDEDLYKHLVTNTHSSSINNASSSFFDSMKIAEGPIVMSEANQNNLWVAGIPIEIFREIFKYLNVLPDLVIVQRVCQEWNRMSNILINSDYKQLELHFGFLKDNIPPYSWWCSIFSKFLHATRIVFCNMAITNELMRLIEFMPNLTTLVFYNCSTKLSMHQIETAHDEQPKEKQSKKRYKFWHDYYHYGGNQYNDNTFAKKRVQEYKKTLEFRGVVTQMMFSKMSEETDVIIPVGLKYINTIPFNREVATHYKQFVENVSSRITGFNSKQKLANLQHIICLPKCFTKSSFNCGMNFSWVNEDRKVYYKCLTGLCDGTIEDFYEKSNFWDTDVTIQSSQGLDRWPFKQLLVNDRAISLIYIDWFKWGTGKLQIYNGIDCDGKTVVDSAHVTSKNSVCLLNQFNLWDQLEPESIPLEKIDVVKCALLKGILNISETYANTYRVNVLQYFLKSIALYFKKAELADEKALRQVCANQSQIGKSVNLIIFLHEKSLITEALKDSCHVYARKIDEYWTDSIFIDHDGEGSNFNSPAKLAGFGEVPVFPFSWITLLEEGEFDVVNAMSEDDDEQVHEDAKGDEMEDEHFVTLCFKNRPKIDSFERGDRSPIERDDYYDDEEMDSTYEESDEDLSYNSDDGEESEEEEEEYSGEEYVSSEDEEQPKVRPQRKKKKTN